MDFCISLEDLSLNDLSVAEQCIRDSVDSSTVSPESLGAILLSLQVLMSCMHRIDRARTRIILNKILARCIQERGTNGSPAADLPISLTRYNVVDIAASFHEILTQTYATEGTDELLVLSPRGYSSLPQSTPVSINRHRLREHNATKKMQNRTKPRIRDISEETGMHAWKRGLRSSGPRTAAQPRRSLSVRRKGKTRSRSLPNRRKQGSTPGASPVKNKSRKKGGLTPKRQLREVDTAVRRSRKAMPRA